MATQTSGSVNGVAAGQKALSTTAATVTAARFGRYKITIKNLEATDGIVVYVGGDSDVGSTTGMPLAGQESISLFTSAAVWAEAASGTPTVAFIEEYQI